MRGTAVRAALTGDLRRMRISTANGEHNRKVSIQRCLSVWLKKPVGQTTASIIQCAHLHRTQVITDKPLSSFIVTLYLSKRVHQLMQVFIVPKQAGASPDDLARNIFDVLVRVPPLSEPQRLGPAAGSGSGDQVLAAQLRRAGSGAAGAGEEAERGMRSWCGALEVRPAKIENCLDLKYLMKAHLDFKGCMYMKAPSIMYLAGFWYQCHAWTMKSRTPNCHWPGQSWQDKWGPTQSNPVMCLQLSPVPAQPLVKHHPS